GAEGGKTVVLSLDVAAPVERYAFWERVFVHPGHHVICERTGGSPQGVGGNADGGLSVAALEEGGGPGELHLGELAQAHSLARGTRQGQTGYVTDMTAGGWHELCDDRVFYPLLREDS